MTHRFYDPQEILQAYEKLEQFRWTESERETYGCARVSHMDDSDSLRTAREEGREEE